MNAATVSAQIQTVKDLQDLIKDGHRIVPAGGQTKPGLIGSTGDATPVDMRGLSGIVDYSPSEYTLTAQAGTPLADVQAALAEHGQYLPFDPPLAKAGATLGGTVAAGISGSGRYRYGGLRDFLIGLRFVDGHGRHVRGGGKVVKNAAGFDFPKLLAGSLGVFGPISEVSFKVFPRPASFATLRVPYTNLAECVTNLSRLTMRPLDLEALDVVPDPQDGAPVALVIRIGGPPGALSARLARLRQSVGDGEELTGDGEAEYWQQTAEFAWAATAANLARVALTTEYLPAFDARMAAEGARRRYAAGGNLAWVATDQSVADLNRVLGDLGLLGVLLRGSADRPYLGHYQPSSFVERVKAAVDPRNCFPSL